MQRLGHHYIAELWECPSDVLDDKDRLQTYVHEAAAAANVTVVNSCFHQFEPQGVTGLLLLSESHISFHSWPEHGYIAVDFFTCGDARSAREAVLGLASRLEAGRLELKTIGRGHLTPIVGEDVTCEVLYPPYHRTSSETPADNEMILPAALSARPEPDK